jgi:hypothetical protein
MRVQLWTVRTAVAAQLLAAALFYTARPSFAACAVITSGSWGCLSGQPPRTGYVFATTDVGVQQANMNFTSGKLQVLVNGTWQNYNDSGTYEGYGSGPLNCPVGTSGETWGSLFSFSRNSGATDLPNGTYTQKTYSYGGAQWSATSNTDQETINCP